MTEQNQEQDSTSLESLECPVPVEPQCVDGVCQLPNGQMCAGGVCELPPQKSMTDWIKWFILFIGVPVVAFIVYHFFIKNKTVDTQLSV